MALRKILILSKKQLGLKFNIITLILIKKVSCTFNSFIWWTKLIGSKIRPLKFSTWVNGILLLRKVLKFRTTSEDGYWWYTSNRSVKWSLMMIFAAAVFKTGRILCIYHRWIFSIFRHYVHENFISPQIIYFISTEVPGR